MHKTEKDISRPPKKMMYRDCSASRLRYIDATSALHTNTSAYLKISA
jgi:hypothetical protein